MVAMADLDIQPAKPGKQIVNTERKIPLTTDELPQPARKDFGAGFHHWHGLDIRDDAAD